MGYELYEVIYHGLQDRSLKDHTIYQLSEEIFHRFYMLCRKKDIHIPYELYQDVKYEIMDEVQKFYRIKTYGFFNIKRYQE
tara:strand:+ start:5557 stop:5799 length:243 start_codon:yes stop_codon:yes gene_type:complete